MARARIKIAKRDIVRLFEEAPKRIYRRADLSEVLSANREFWRLAQSETVDSFSEFLAAETKLACARLKFPSRTETRYTWGDVPLLELLLSLRSGAYLSHYSAMYVHEMTRQIPKTLYLNCEQTPKPAPSGELVQERIDAAFRRPARTSSMCADFGGYTVYILSGKHTAQLGVIDADGPAGETVRVTNLERTLIDITVRPNYSGGVFEVLDAFRLARERISVNRLSAFLKKLDFIYPYDQALGFYLDRAGGYKQSQIALFRKRKFEFDFYLCHGMKDMAYSKEWRLFYPKGQ